MTFFLKISKRNKVKYDELRSMLQKAIRRGNKEEALFCAEEFNIDGYGNAVWNNLKLIATEDIGLGECTATTVINEKYKEWLDVVKKENKKAGVLRSKTTECYKYENANTILYSGTVYLSNCKKSRMLPQLCYLYLFNVQSTYIADKRLQLVYNAWKDKCEDAPLYIFDNVFKDCQYKQVKKVGFVLARLLESKFRQATEKLILLCTTYLYYWGYHQQLIRIVELSVLKKNIPVLTDAFHNNKALFIETKQKLYLYQMVLHVYRIAELDVCTTNYEQVDNADGYEFKGVPDYALDKHTRRGKQLKRGILHFQTVGVLVNNLNEKLLDPYSALGKRAYEEDEQQHGTRNAKSAKLLKRKEAFFENYKNLNVETNKRKRKQPPTKKISKLAKYIK